MNNDYIEQNIQNFQENEDIKINNSNNNMSQRKEKENI